LTAGYLNTPRLIADATGTTVWRWDQQEPFGNSAANDDPDGNSVAFDLPLRLPGQYYDQETNLAYNYYRSYHPAIGRYSRSDPSGYRGGLNSYAYAGGNPLLLGDPFGLAPFGLEKLEELLIELGAQVGIVSASPAAKAGAKWASPAFPETTLSPR
jgi:RHS repeat-associated protein